MDLLGAGKIHIGPRGSILYHAFADAGVVSVASQNILTFFSQQKITVYLIM